MRGADRLPSPQRFRQSSQDKSPKPSPLFDLSKNRFLHGLGQLINRLSLWRPQVVPHLLRHAGSGRQRPSRAGRFLSVLLPVWRHEQVDPLQLRIRYVLLTEIPGVRRRFAATLSEDGQVMLENARGVILQLMAEAVPMGISWCNSASSGASRTVLEKG